MDYTQVAISNQKQKINNLIKEWYLFVILYLYVLSSSLSLYIFVFDGISYFDSGVMVTRRL